VNKCINFQKLAANLHELCIFAAKFLLNTKVNEPKETICCFFAVGNSNDNLDGAGDAIYSR
jgi:hypothetical protein